MRRIETGIASVVLATFALAGCNSDSGFVPTTVPTVNTSAEGVYSGSLASGPLGATDFLAIVLEDGSFWTLYGQAGATSFTVQGFARGSGTSSDGTFASSAATDFGASPPATFTLDATYNSALDTMEGSITTGATTSTFAGGAISSGPYDYGAAPDPQIVTGTWTVQDADGVSYALVVAADGTFNFAEQGGGCTGAGSFSPRASGKNVFDVSVQFDDVAECADQNGSATGIALAYPLTGTDTIQLIAAVNDQSTFGFAIFGTHPSP